MKVSFINPPSHKTAYIREGRCTQASNIWSLVYPPLSLAQIASYVRNNCTVDVAGIDYSVESSTFSMAIEEISKRNDKLIVVATGTPSIKSDLEFCEKIKKKNPEINIAVIGTHASHYAAKLIKDCDYIDFIVHGEPERPILNIIKSLSNGSALDNRAITTRTSSNTDLLLIEDLDDLPIPAWDLFDLNKYRLPLRNKKFLMITPQRGCPWKCTFCTAPLYYGNKIRSKSIEKIKEEIKYIKENYNIDNFLFWSDTFTANKVFVTQLCNAIKDLNISWVSNSRVDTINDDLAKEMKAAGCWMLTYGIESLNDDVLMLAKKSITSSQVKDGVLASRNNGILTVGHFIIGLPGDSKASLKRTFKEARKLKLDYMQFYYASPFPGTKLHQELLAKRIIQDDPYEEFSQSLSEVLKQYKFIALSLKLKTLLRFKTFIFVFKNLKARLS